MKRKMSDVFQCLIQAAIDTTHLDVDATPPQTMMRIEATTPPDVQLSPTKRERNEPPSTRRALFQEKPRLFICGTTTFFAPKITKDGGCMRVIVTVTDPECVKRVEYVWLEQMERHNQTGQVKMCLQQMMLVKSQKKIADNKFETIVELSPSVMAVMMLNITQNSEFLVSASVSLDPYDGNIYRIRPAFMHLGVLSLKNRSL